MTRYTRRGWPVNSATVGGTGALTLATTFLETNAHPVGTAVVGAVLIGLASRLRHREAASQPQGSSATARTYANPTAP